ncbi:MULTISPECIES: hypothetical protein [Vibrio]|uniref:hypothetical protein n=1 Tax=Vibrio TaxID=662 RepID=UPI0005F0AF26|nr:MULTISPECIES: hypothetical protein [Vibrio]
MQMTKVAVAVALSTGLLVGCNTDLRDETSPTTPTPDASLANGYWSIEEVAATSTASDLPNIYVFDEGTQKYYNDDDNFGTYTIYDATYTEDVDAGTLTFTYYGNSADLTDTTEVTGNYSVTDEILTISDTNLGELTGSNEVDTAGVLDAIANANTDAGLNNVVQILDTNNAGTLEDTGELRIKLADSTSVASIESGKLTVDLVYQNDEDTEQEADGSGDNAYISFYAAKTSNSNLHGEVAFENGVIKYRDASGSLTDAGGTFELGENLAVEVTWGPEAFSFSVNGINYADNLPVADGTAVTTISLRLGDNGNTTNFELLGDNLIVYSNDSGTETEVLNEDFDSYASGTDLATKYNSSSNEATVVGSAGSEPTEPSEVTDDFESYTLGTLISDANGSWTTSNIKDDELGTTTAEVSDDQSNGGTQSLFLADNHTGSKPFAMREFSAPATSGSVSLDVYFPSTNEKSTYINIGNGKNNSNRYFELNQSGSTLKYEAGDNDVTIASDIARDTWHSITLAWSAAGLITVSMNGEVIAENVEQSSTGLDSSIVPSQLTLYTGDNSGNSNKAYFDNVDSTLF